MRKADVVTDLDIERDDFAKNTDIVQVSDPHIFSETQRMAQNQAVLALVDKYPDQFNVSKVLSRFLKQLKVPDINEIMKDVPAPEQRTSADENAAMLIGQPAYAYMQQDHIAHIQDHLQFAMNPFLGQSPFADPGYLNNVIEHLKQHMTLWYLNRSNAYVAESRGGKPVNNYDDPKLTSSIDQLYAVVGAHVEQDTKEVFQAFAPAFQSLIQQAQQRQQAAQGGLPPDAQVVKDTSMAETQRKAAKDKADQQIAQARLQVEAQRNQLDNQTRIQIENAKLTHETINHAADLQQQNLQSAQQPQPAQGPQQGVLNGI
jgi:hypothetical protein